MSQTNSPSFFTRLQKIIKRFFAVVFFFCFILIGIYVFKIPILQKVGDTLCRAEKVEKAEVLFILGAATFERCKAAASLCQTAEIEKVIGTGEIINPLLAAAGCTPMNDAQLTQTTLLSMGVDSSKIELLPQGTSTYEEAQTILNYCQTHHLQRIAVMTSMFHTRRVSLVFQKVFQHQPIKVLICGAEPVTYQRADWWNYEEGLIFVVNEYIKLGYYKLKGKI